MLWACLEAAGGNQWIAKLITIAIAIAITAAMAVIVIDRRLVMKTRPPAGRGPLSEAPPHRERDPNAFRPRTAASLTGRGSP